MVWTRPMLYDKAVEACKALKESIADVSLAALFHILKNQLNLETKKINSIFPLLLRDLQKDVLKLSFWERFLMNSKNWPVQSIFELACTRLLLMDQHPMSTGNALQEKQLLFETEKKFIFFYFLNWSHLPTTWPQPYVFIKFLWLLRKRGGMTVDTTK